MIDEVIKDIIEERINGIHTFMLARVVSSSPLQVRPLQKVTYTDGRSEDYPVITARQVHRKGSTPTTYDAGDTVAVAFLERAEGNEKHGLSGAIVLGVVS